MIGLPCSSDSKASAYNAGEPGSIPGSGRSLGEGNGNPLQYSCLENSMDQGALWATVHEVAKSRTQLSNFTHSPVLCVEDKAVWYLWKVVFLLSKSLSINFP